MSKTNEARSPSEQRPLFQTLWQQPPVCKCAGTGRMPILGWPGRTIICACGAGKHIAASGLMQPGDMRWV